tara:strand:+ start:46443 stop:46634 length:192 start_codon:yes stop_codon:yes gene_type:complete
MIKFLRNFYKEVQKLSVNKLILHFSLAFITCIWISSAVAIFTTILVVLYGVELVIRLYAKRDI